MSIPTVTYDEFSTSNQATVTHQGPWIVQSEIEYNAECEDQSASWCGGYCLTCEVYPENTSPTFQGSFATNISVNLANYGGATSLDFTWNYWPLYCGSNTTAGSDIPITSQVGDAKFDESFPSVNYTTFFGTNGGRQWQNTSKISHNGSTSVVRGSDPNIGYIAISMSIPMTYSVDNEEEYLNFYVKGIKFLITTPIQSVAPSSSSATSATSTQQVGGSSTPSSSSTPSAGVIAGAVIGALAFVALFILAVCLIRRQRKKEENPVDNTTISTEQINHDAPTPMEEGAVSPPRLNTRYHSGRQPSVASFRPDSFITRGSYGPPPTYGPDESIGHVRVPLTPSSPELAQFAAANREAINENLEARLQAAGYLPTEDPSRLTPDEWRNEYGITKLELRRLQNLYERTQQVQPQ